MSLGRGRALRPVRDRAGRWLHTLIDRRVAERLAQELPALEQQIYERLRSAPVDESAVSANQGGGLPAAVDVETDVGRMYAHANDEGIASGPAAGGGWDEPGLRALHEQLKPGMTVLDVGASVGYVTLLAAGAVGGEGLVVAVEPHPANLRLLRANVARHAHPHVEVVAAAAVLPDDAVPVDRPVDVVALDTRATEHLALSGASHVVARWRPRIYAQYWPDALRRRGDDPTAVLRGLRERGYAIRVPAAPELGPDAAEAELISAVDACSVPSGGRVTLELSTAIPR